VFGLNRVLFRSVNSAWIARLLRPWTNFPSKTLVISVIVLWSLKKLKLSISLRMNYFLEKRSFMLHSVIHSFPCPLFL